MVVTNMFVTTAIRTPTTNMFVTSAIRTMTTNTFVTNAIRTTTTNTFVTSAIRTTTTNTFATSGFAAGRRDGAWGGTVSMSYGEGCVGTGDEHRPEVPGVSMLLQGKTAVVYGGGGSVGGAIARAFGRNGAAVHLAGRTEATLQSVADDIAGAGGTAYVDVVDALDEAAVDGHMKRVVERGGRLDVSVNVISDQDVQGTPMVEMDVEDYLRPVATAVRSKFLTARAAARVMVPQQGGVILFFGGNSTGRLPASSASAGSGSRSMPSSPCGGSSPASWGGTGSG
ncbi:SDR family NAD(P)-dependent oxidoreductase [Dactylosporangium darangshiense]|uniref:SDR family NAD(P)-dependent oxidoreductase n=1 Tax=Dactylosporangium darangshiense TaxID=579108 RepID=UPI003641D38C